MPSRILVISSMDFRLVSLSKSAGLGDRSCTGDGPGLEGGPVTTVRLDKALGAEVAGGNARSDLGAADEEVELLFALF